MNQDFNTKRLERYLTLSWQSGAIPVVVLTKADLVDEYAPYVRIVESFAVGVPVCAVSAKTGVDLDSLADYMMPGKQLYFAAPPGWVNRVL